MPLILSHCIGSICSLEILDAIRGLVDILTGFAGSKPTDLQTGFTIATGASFISRQMALKRMGLQKTVFNSSILIFLFSVLFDIKFNSGNNSKSV